MIGDRIGCEINSDLSIFVYISNVSLWARRLAKEGKIRPIDQGCLLSMYIILSFE